MKVGYICALSWEHSYPHIRENFDEDVWCRSDSSIMRFPRAVMERGVEPVFFYFTSRRVPVAEFRHKSGFRMIRVPVRRRFGMNEEYSLRLLEEIRRERCDLLHFFSYYRNEYYPDLFDIFARYCAWKGLPLVAHYQGGSFPGCPARSLLKKLVFLPKRIVKAGSLRRARRLFVISRAEIRRLTDPSDPEHYGLRFDASRITYLPNILDPGLFFPMDRSTAARQIQIDPAARRILYVGYLREAKGVQHVVRILPELLAERADLQFLVVGRGEYEAPLRALVQQMGLEKTVQFAGPVPNDRLCPYYSSADVHVLPSYAEGMPSVVLEALACNVPSVGTRVGGVVDLLDGGAGLLVPPHDEPALRDALRRVLTGTFRIDAGQRARKLKEHSFEAAGTILTRSYEAILNGGSAPDGGVA